MLLSAHRIDGANVKARDGDIGRVKTLLFDDEQWVVRYVVVKRGFWIFSRQTLISPLSVVSNLGGAKAISTNLTREQIKNAPRADLARPVSRRMEEQMHQYYGVPIYWGGAGLWGSAVTPVEAGAVAYSPSMAKEPIAATEDEYHLRSSHEVQGYSVEARGGTRIGTVDDLLIEDSTWAIRYLRVAATNELGGGSIYVSPHWVEDLTWISASLTLDVPMQTLRERPKVGENGTLDRKEEIMIHEFFGRPRYWL